MNRQNVIVVIAPTIEVWGNFRKLCVAKGFDVLPYHSLKSKPFHINVLKLKGGIKQINL